MCRSARRKTNEICIIGAVKKPLFLCVLRFCENLAVAEEINDAEYKEVVLCYKSILLIIMKICIIDVGG